MSKSRSTPEWAVLQICPNDATTLPPQPDLCTHLGRRWKEGEDWGCQRMGSLVAHPLWHQWPTDHPGTLFPGFSTS